jgi:lysozyme
MSTTDPPPDRSFAPRNTPIKNSLSAKGLEFIERHEGYSDKVYQDVAGNPTIGYGHLIRPGEDFSNGITRSQAMQLLSKDTESAVDSVNHKVTIDLAQVQFDALVDFTFNLGGAAFGRSVLLRNVNSGQTVTLKNFTDWDHAGGEIVPGLLKRRTDEFNLYAKGDYGPPQRR